MEGVDCSGLWVEILQSLGIIGPSDDFPAAAMFDMFDPVQQYMEGDMIFWQNSSGKVVHVEMIYDVELRLAIGASGGGSRTKSFSTAVSDNAYVKIRPYLDRGRGIAGVCNPYTFKGTE